MHKMNAEEWNENRKHLREMFDGGDGDTSYLAAVLCDLGDAVFAEEKPTPGSLAFVEHFMNRDQLVAFVAGQIDERIMGTEVRGVRPDVIITDDLAEEPKKFARGDEVVTKCREAIPGTSIFERGSKGVVTNPTRTSSGTISVRLSNGCIWYVYEDQLELVPEKPKQAFWEGDLIEAKGDHFGRLTAGRSYVVLSVDMSERLERGGFVDVWNDLGDTEPFFAQRFRLKKPGPNHPTDC